MLEQDVYPYLEAQGIPGELWEFYAAYARRMWNRRVMFTDETFLLEKQSLKNEFVWRGLNLTHLEAIQVFAEERAEQKIIGPAPPPPKVGLFGGAAAPVIAAASVVIGASQPPERLSVELQGVIPMAAGISVLTSEVSPVGEAEAPEVLTSEASPVPESHGPYMSVNEELEEET